MGAPYVIPISGRLLAVKEVAGALSMSPRTVRRWLREGRINYIKLGRATRISEYELRRLLSLGAHLSQQ